MRVRWAGTFARGSRRKVHNVLTVQWPARVPLKRALPMLDLDPI